MLLLVGESAWHWARNRDCCMRVFRCYVMFGSVRLCHDPLCNVRVLCVVG